MDKKLLRKALIEAADWDKNLTYRQRAEISYHEAKMERVDEILAKLIRGSNPVTPPIPERGNISDIAEDLTNLGQGSAPYSHVNSRGQTFYLHFKDVQLRGSGRTQTIFYFANEIKTGALDRVPAGKIVIENERTGLLFLKGR